MRQIPIYGGMSKGGHWSVRQKNAVVVAYALVDDRDFKRLSEFLWLLSDRGDSPKSHASKSKYAITLIKKKRFFMHHMVLPREEGFDVAHKNGDPLDNQRKNLELVSHAENMLNPHDGAYKHNASTGLRNVYSHGNHYRAQIQVGGKNIVGSLRSTIEEAAADVAELRVKALAMVRQPLAGV